MCCRKEILRSIERSMAFPQNSDLSKNVNVYMPRSYYDEITEIAQNFDISRGDVIRRLIGNSIKNGVNAVDLFPDRVTAK